jgi:hypothetical protein
VLAFTAANDSSTPQVPGVHHAKAVVTTVATSQTTIVFVSVCVRSGGILRAETRFDVQGTVLGTEASVSSPISLVGLVS